MLSSNLNTQRSQTSGKTKVLSNVISPTPIYPLSTNAASIVAQALPSPLATPAGWHSEVIDSDTPLPIDVGINRINTINTSQINRIPTRYINTTNQYVDTAIGGNTAYQQQSVLTEQQQPILVGQQQSILTEQQQRNLINMVETQQPPPIFLRKTLPNNLVTYKQNIAVRYLQPPTPPPPGPLIIRK
jgi:hypothetical protein